VFFSSWCWHHCSGVVLHYFLPRWSLFLNALNNSLVTGIPFNQTLTSEQIFREVEEPFTRDTTVFPTSPQGNETSQTFSFSFFMSFLYFSFMFICFYSFFLSLCLSLFLHSSTPYILSLSSVPLHDCLKITYKKKGKQVIFLTFIYW
jgi:hypothetical protein